MTSKGKCVFPFVYKDKTYNECTMDAAEELWCAYVVDKENVMTEWEKCLFRKFSINDSDFSFSRPYSYCIRDLKMINLV